MSRQLKRVIRRLDKLRSVFYSSCCEPAQYENIVAKSIEIIEFIANKIKKYPVAENSEVVFSLYARHITIKYVGKGNLNVIVNVRHGRVDVLLRRHLATTRFATYILGDDLGLLARLLLQGYKKPKKIKSAINPAKLN